MSIRFFFLVIGVLALSLPACAQTIFFDSVPDIPVAPGLTVLPEETVSFDKPDGRIVEAVAQFDVYGDHSGASGIRYYYDEVLPSLGWIEVADQKYRRGDEVLKFWFEPIDDQTYFHVMVEPAE